eukprot:5563686-Alexandrium_andersonii.AAC.1
MQLHGLHSLRAQQWDMMGPELTGRAAWGPSLVSAGCHSPPPGLGHPRPKRMHGLGQHSIE